MQSAEQILQKISNRTSVLNKVIAVALPIGVLITGAFWYLDNIWHPTVELLNVDYDKKTATLRINGHDRVLYAGSTISAGFGWGVQFGGFTTDEYNRIEIVKNDIVHKTISVKEE
jgi:hypothetical protein